MARSTEFTRARSAEARSASGGRPDVVDEGLLGEMAHEHAQGQSYVEERDWARAGMFGAGLALGLLIGAGAALLFTPNTGEETRAMLGERARDLGGYASDRWDDLRGELRWLGRRGRKQMGRRVTRGRWAAEDAWDRGRKRFS